MCFQYKFQMFQKYMVQVYWFESEMFVYVQM